MAYDVFISFKNTAPGGGLTVDRAIAERLHTKLRDEGLEVFFSERDLSTTAFMNEIYRALEEAPLLILIGSSIEYIKSKWVMSEWQNFLGAMNIGKKPDGEIMTVLSGITNRDLPIELANFQSYDADDLDGAVDFAFKALGKVKKSEAAAWLAQEEERKRREAEEAALIAAQKQLEAERQAAKEKAAAEKRRQKALAAAERERQKRLNAEKKAAEAQEKNKKQAGQNKALKIVAAVLCLLLVVGGAVGVGAYVKQQREIARIAEEQRIAEEKQIEKEKQEAKEKQLAEEKYQEESNKWDLTPNSVDDYKLDAIYDFEWADNGLAIRNYSGSNREVVLPEEYNGNPVVHLGDDLFLQNDKLISVSIPDSVTSLGNCVFKHCTNLSSIAIPDSVTSIGNSAFSCCDSLTSINIPNGVTVIGNSAFDDCDNLTSVTIPDSVTRIGDGTFRNCPNLSLITIPDNVTTIGHYAFWGCNSLTSITIPDGVTRIGEYAFYNCNSLTSITIPDSVTSIGDRAFEDCTITVTAPHEASYYGYTPDKGVTWVVK